MSTVEVNKPQIHVLEFYHGPKGDQGPEGAGVEEHRALGLSDHSDVSIANPLVGHVLAFDGSRWVNAETEPLSEVTIDGGSY